MFRSSRTLITNTALIRKATSRNSFLARSLAFYTPNRREEPQRTLPLPCIRVLSTRTSKSTLRERTKEHAANLRQSASNIRDQAAERLQTVRENPAESARSFGSMIRLYGPVFLGTYFCVYVATLGSLFMGVESGVLDPVHVMQSWGVGEGTESTVQFVVDWMKSHTLTEPYAETVKKNPELGNLAVAWIAVKFTEPVRFAVTLALTPRVARAIGWTVKKEEETEQDQEEKDTTKSA